MAVSGASRAEKMNRLLLEVGLKAKCYYFTEEWGENGLRYKGVDQREAERLEGELRKVSSTLVKIDGIQWTAERHPESTARIMEVIDEWKERKRVPA